MFFGTSAETGLWCWTHLGLQTSSQD